MKPLKRNLRLCMVLMISLYTLLIGYFCYTLLIYGERWFSDPHNTRMRVDAAQPKIIPGQLLDRRMTVLAETRSAGRGEARSYFRHYPRESRYAAHVIGSKQYGIGGEVHFIRYLLGYDNHLLERIYQKAFLAQEVGNDVILTIDLRLQRMITEEMGRRTGSVVLLNPQNGEILALVSLPAFRPDQPETEPPKDGLLNKAFQGRYPPGSILKVLTSAAALKELDGALEHSLQCAGTTDVQGVAIRCFNGEAHGTVDFKRAMAVSCNAFFADLALTMGWRPVLRMGKAFGFNEDFLFSEMKTVRSELPLSRQTGSEELAWSAVGQGRVLVSPLHMALVAAAAANEGVMPEPRLIHGIRRRNGSIASARGQTRWRTPIDADIAAVLKEAMEGVVREGTGRYARVRGLTIAGKTGTAETGRNTAPHAWFIGFVAEDTPTLAIAMLIEHAGTGGGQAAPLAGKILAEARRLGY